MSQMGIVLVDGCSPTNGVPPPSHFKAIETHAVCPPVTVIAGEK
jgi:hypothetical protein